jgi:L-asparaginase II
LTEPGPIAEVTRRDERRGDHHVESAHRGTVVLTDGDGAVLAALGDPQRSTFVRSTAKPFQAATCLELLDLSGGEPSTAEVAVAWASHRGERQHIDAVRRLLARSATPAERLTCPPDRPEADPGATPARILHNCSGKHALFALAGTEQACPQDRLLDADGPLQRPVLAGVEAALGPFDAVAVDGCGAPAVAVPLSRLARGYASLASEPRWARVRDAGLAHPWLVGGGGRLESELLAAGLVAKVGAEGVFAVGWVDERGRSRGLAVKAEDGATRAAAAATIELLEALGVVKTDLWRPSAPQGGGRPVGHVRARPEVLRLA